jgi:hypothetical protein
VCIEAAVAPFRLSDLVEVGQPKHLYRRSDVESAAASAGES